MESEYLQLIYSVLSFDRHCNLLLAAYFLSIKRNDLLLHNFIGKHYFLTANLATRFGS